MPNSRGFFWGVGLSGTFRSTYFRFASPGYSQMEGVFSGTACVPHPGSSPVPYYSGRCWWSRRSSRSRPPGSFPPCTAGFPAQRERYDLPVNAVEQIWPFELLCVLSACIWGAGVQPPPSQGLTLRPYSLYRRVKNWYAWLEKTPWFLVSSKVQYPKTWTYKRALLTMQLQFCCTWSRRALWPHVRPQTASEYTETLEIRALKSNCFGAERTTNCYKQL